MASPKIEVWVVVPLAINHHLHAAREDTQFESDIAIQHGLIPKTFEDEESARQYIRDLTEQEDKVDLDRGTFLELLIQKTEFVPAVHVSAKSASIP